jgi:cephalosporin hydroxylase
MTVTNREPRVCDDFHKYYEENKLWDKLRWMGIPMWKLPFDAMVVQNLIYKLKPDNIIETGTGMGGSSAFYATILEIIGNGLVITIDIENRHNIDLIPKKLRDRITFIQSSSTEVATVVRLYNRCRERKNLVILDSWHTQDHVFNELNDYCDLVPVGSYIIVEDSHVNGHPIDWKWGNGPYEAIHEFLETPKGKSFIIDKTIEHQMMTFNPDGFLKRVN